MTITLPTAYWKLEDVNESVGALTLTNTGTVTFSTGKVGNAAYLNGTDQFLSHADNAAFDMGDIDFTMAAWFYTATVAAGHGYVINKELTHEEYALRRSAASLIWSVRGTTGITHTATLLINTWYLAVAYHDATNNLIGISLNGAAFETAADTGVAASSDGAFRIGARYVPDRFFSGRIDEVGIWKGTVLSAAQAAELYNGGAGVTYPFPTSGGSPSFTQPFTKPFTERDFCRGAY